ncbi:MAG: hypothetical protein AAF378_12125 [Cyanobacteria bacterium P01_A01_bin.84]
MFPNITKIIFYFSQGLNKTFFISISLLLLVLEPTVASVKINQLKSEPNLKLKLYKDIINYSGNENNFKLLKLSANLDLLSLLFRDKEKQKVKNSQKKNCTEKDVKTLVNQMLLDLPAYTNRQTQRARRLKRKNEVYSYILLAGNPDFKPLALNNEEYVQTQKKSTGEVEQVFFTTLERHYLKDKAVELQQFHWVFLTKSKSGWRMVMMFSQIGSYPKDEVPTPPRNSSNGAIAQATKTWLRDCRAGSV